MDDQTRSEPTVIDGGLAVDDRGFLIFANSFDFADVKRFYQVENFSCDTVRAWHGHLKEGKYVYASSGSAIVAAVKMDDPVAPSREQKIHRFVLSAKKPFLLFIPAGYANGFRSLEPGTRIIYYSTSTLEESKGDDYRFAHDYWGTAVWEVDHR